MKAWIKTLLFIAAGAFAGAACAQNKVGDECPLTKDVGGVPMVVATSFTEGREILVCDNRKFRKATPYELELASSIALKEQGFYRDRRDCVYSVEYRRSGEPYLSSAHSNPSRCKAAPKSVKQ